MTLTIQEIFNLAYDETTESLNVSSASSAEDTDGRVQDILNKSFNSSSNTLEVIAS